MQPYATLNTGQRIPLFGLGVYDMHGDRAVNAIRYALEIGYRLIDTAQAYENEEEVGTALRQSSLPREDVFLTTKIANTVAGRADVIASFEESLRKLDADYVDLLLLHWPVKDRRRENWKAIEEIGRSGRARSIGVGNYLIPFLHEMPDYATVTPALDQIEYSPYLVMQQELEHCRRHGILLQAYTPLIRGQRFGDPKLVAMAEKYGKTPAQIMLRWCIQQGISAIPKSVEPARIRENFDIFDFSISEADMAALTGFDEGLRIIEDPMDMW
jgi:diketogulonate reductase-like aldo/keto reductase